MLDALTPVTSVLAAALAIAFAVWTFFICKLIFLGKPRNVSFKAFGVNIEVSAADCSKCGAVNGSNT